MNDDICDFLCDKIETDVNDDHKVQKQFQLIKFIVLKKQWRNVDGYQIEGYDVDWGYYKLPKHLKTWFMLDQTEVLVLSFSYVILVLW